MHKCEVLQLGEIKYKEAWELQVHLASQIASGQRPPTLLLLQHPHTYTLGSSGKPENLLWTEQECEQHGVAIEWVDRGGDVTYHGPGQLVGYPILPLVPGGLVAHSQNGSPRVPTIDYIGYLRNLEKVLVRTLANLGIVSGQIPGLTGVWVQPDVASRCRHCSPEAKQKPSKIASIGVKIDVNGVSRHGFSLNLTTNREFWNGIIGCGLPDHPVVNIADLLYSPPTMEELIQKTISSFGEVFGLEMTPAGLKSVLINP